MVKRILGAIIAAFTGPFAIAFYAAIFIAVGGIAGFVVYSKMEAAEAARKAAEKAAIEEAARGPLPPQRVPDAPQDDPFVPRYISLGDEILSNLPGRRRALIIQLELMTQRGEEVEALITKNRMPLRAMTLAVLSELKVEDVTRPDATQLVAERLRIALNNFLRPGNSGINAIDQVLVKRLFVQ